MLDEVIVTDFQKIELDSFINTYCPAMVTTDLRNQENITKNKLVKRVELNLPVFNYNFKKPFQQLLKKNNFPSFNIVLYATLQHLGCATHSVHTDSDAGFRKYGSVICRFLIPLTKASPTCYFDKLMPDNRFYRRKTKFKFEVEGHKTFPTITIKNLINLRNKITKPINDKLPAYDKLSHINPELLYGLEVDTLGEWEIGAIHLFPCSLLHASTDFDWYDSKYMINGVIYTPK